MTIWVADIGGTNCRLASFSETDCVREENYPTGSIRTAADLLDVFAASFPEDKALGIAIAAAGKTEGKTVTLTNAACTLDCSALPLPCLLMNDFTAQAYATLSPLTHVCSCRKGKSVAHRRAVLGPGTGLGCASLMRTESEWTVISSEGGHMAFPFSRREDERAYQDYLAGLGLESPSCETVLSGQGLARLHTFLTGDPLSPKDVGERFLRAPSETLALYSRFLGRFSAMWMLATVCTGGLWIGGGIAIQNPLCVQTDDFLCELSPRVPHSWIHDVPVSLFQDTRVGLFGAAWALRQALDCSGRLGSSAHS